MNSDPHPDSVRRPRGGDLLANSALFALIASAAGAADSLRIESSNVLGWLALCALALRCRFGFAQPGERRAAWLALCVWVAAGWLWVAAPSLRPLAAALAVWVAAARVPGGIAVGAWCWTLGVVSVWVLAQGAFPRFHDLQRDLTREVSLALGSIVGVRSDFGPVAFGLPTWITAGVLSVAWAARRSAGRWQRLAAAAGAGFACVLVHLYVSEVYARDLLHRIVGFEAPEISGGLICLGWAALLYGGLAARLRPVALEPFDGSRRQPWGAALAGALGLLVALMPQRDSSEPLRGRVLLFDAGHLSWSSPNGRIYGKNSSGMFGLLPDRIRFNGLDVERSGRLDDEYLGDVDCIFTINLQESLDPQQHEAVWRFVERGGTLVCLGDHTGLGGIREPFNDLLEPVGIEFEFDSAKPINGDWGRGLRTFPSRLTAGLFDGDQIPIGVGASLVVPFGARVLVSGVRAFADGGDTTRPDMGYLGDYTYRAGEPLGDLPLVCEATRGEGRVLVFGDTSPFQNGSFGQGHLFMDNFLRYALDDDGSTRRRTVAMFLAIGLLAGAASAFARGGRSFGAALCLSTLPFAAFAPWSTAEELPGSFEETWTPAVLDVSHGQQCDLRWWQDDSIGGVILGMFRNGLWPRIAVDGLRLEGQELAVLFAPGKPIEGAELDRLLSFMEEGGVVLCTAGHDSGDHSRELLEQFGFHLSDAPLGPAEGEAFGEPVHFQCAYPIDGAPSSFHPVAHAYDRPVAGWTPIGEGAFFLISDSRFFQNPNLEDKEVFVPDNVAFFAALIDHLRTEELL